MTGQQAPATVEAGSGARNEVTVRGRLAADPVPRVLPSGAEITGFRLVIERAATEMTRGSQQKSDWIECTAWKKALRNRVGGWRPGDVVEVEGSLRRRFIRRESGAGSLVEIEALHVRMIDRAPRVERAAPPAAVDTAVDTAVDAASG